MTTQTTFAERLATLRKQRNLSQTKLGELIGVHYTHISRYERGISHPSMDTLQRLAEVLEVTGDFLLNGALQETAKSQFEDRELLRQFQEVETLPEADKLVVKALLDAFLFKKRVQEMAIR